MTRFPPSRRCRARAALVPGGLVLCALLASPAAAQGTIRGVVYDSLLSNRPLAGATVVVHGTLQRAETDRRGRFVLTGVPAGDVAVGFFHPLLDSLGIAAPAALVQMLDSITVTQDLAVPSADGVTRTLCGRDAERATAVVFGQVRAAENDAPLAGARASVSWYELVLTGASPRQSRRVSRSISDANGRYALCNVPNDISLTLAVSHGAFVSGPLQLTLDTLPVARRDVWVTTTDSAALRSREDSLVDGDISRGASPPDSAALPTAHPGRARLAVRVRDPQGADVAGAIVGIRGRDRAGTTPGSGRVRLDSLPAGSHTLVVRAVGYLPSVSLVALRPDSTVSVDVTLGAVAPELPAVAVVGRPSATRIFDAGFERRRTRGIGYFFANVDIGPGPSSAQFWQQVPGVQLAERGPDILPMMQGGTFGPCIPQVFLNGMRMGRVDAWELRSWLLGAKHLEVYPRASQVPAEFTQLGDTAQCGAIVVWTH